MAEVLIVSYGDKAALAPLLRSLDQQTRKPAAVRIWHNGPDQPTGEGNLGFGEGVNRLVAQARDDVVIVVNPDCELQPDCLEQLERGLGDAAAAAAVLVDPRGRVNAYGQKLTLDLVGINTDRGGPADTLGDAGYLGPSGALFALRLSRVPFRPIFPASFFLYLEDVALWLKLRAAGARIAFVPAARAVHHWSVSTGQRSALKLYSVERNRLWLSRAVRGWPATVASLPFTAARYAAYGGPRAASSGAASALARALRDGLFQPLPQDVVDYFRGVKVPAGYFAALRDQLRNPVGPDEG